MIFSFLKLVGAESDNGVLISYNKIAEDNCLYTCLDLLRTMLSESNCLEYAKENIIHYYGSEASVN